jgi:hypothetical protein
MVLPVPQLGAKSSPVPEYFGLVSNVCLIENIFLENFV